MLNNNSKTPALCSATQRSAAQRDAGGNRP